MPINGKRLNDRLAQLAEIGKTSDTGVTRITLTGVYMQALEQVRRWMEDAGLETRLDAVGNLIGRLEGTEADLRAIVLGSHVDTVIDGGRYDGSAGVLSAIEVVQALQEEGLATRHPIEVISFMEEEGTRWGTSMLGSRFMLGEVTPEYMRERTDRDGISIVQAMQDAGLDPERYSEAVRDPKEFKAYIELHIEQGAVLESQGVPIGAVTGIAGPLFVGVEIKGRTDHAGATPMNLRRDALVAAANLVVEAQQAALDVSPTAVATVGRLEVKPGAVNAIPGSVYMTFDLRDIVEEKRDQLEQRMRTATTRVTEEEDVEYQWEEMSRHKPVQLPEHMIATIVQASEKEDVPVIRLPSGAGHDAQILARYVDTAMIFLRSKDGISHSPNEYTSPEDITAGAKVFRQAVLLLDSETE